MRKSPTKKIEKYRVTEGPYGSTEDYGARSAFHVPYNGAILKIIASDGSDWSEAELPGEPWEHVSVSLQARTPTWQEMDYVKRLFWADDETVLQFHVPRNQHINTHEYTLHLWRQVSVEVARPPQICV